MAIQHRRGAYSAFDPSRLMPGEWAVVLSGDGSTLDGKAVYICFAAGDVKRMSTVEDLHHDVEAIEADIVSDLTEMCATASQAAMDAAERAAGEAGTAAEATMACETATRDAIDASAVLVTLAETCAVAAQGAIDASAELATLNDRMGHLEGLGVDYPRLVADVAEMQRCCQRARSDFRGLAWTLAALSGAWLCACESLFAPSAEAASVTGTTTTVQGTVSGTTLTVT